MLPTAVYLKAFGTTSLVIVNVHVLYLLIVSFMKRDVIHRMDGSPAFPYWKAKDLGVEEEVFSFLSGRWKLYGSRYFVGKGPYKALVVFYHGIGAGRNAYVQPICDLAKQGYLVYAFDNTGSMQSEGPSHLWFRPNRVG
jgi:pimeloyl-ACP methyl ester carboxylesterase